jgi:hypothetical protein
MQRPDIYILICRDAFSELKAMLETRGSTDIANTLDPTTGLTPLMYAVVQDNEPIAALLIANGARLEEVDRTESTAMHWAARMNHAASVLTLIVSGARVLVRDKNNKTPRDVSTGVETSSILKTEEDLILSVPAMRALELYETRDFDTEDLRTICKMDENLVLRMVEHAFPCVLG